MGQTFSVIISRLEDLYQKGIQLQKEFEIAEKEGKPGKLQQLRIRDRALQDQLKHISKRLKQKVEGQIVQVTFRFNGYKCHGKFVNWSDDDVYRYYKCLGKVHNVQVDIISIERQNTFITDVPFEKIE